MSVVGDPEHCVKRLRAIAEAGVDHVLLAFGAGAMPSEAVQDSMRLFAERVAPELER
jgi:alkanesulfonate monooxygenase SsuD/methylene tetrahydromethanopterin reductase-like flavin-dependent oxidoreductase (luciferase family)